MLPNPLFLSLVKYVLGSELVDYFDLIHLEETGESLHIHPDELNIISDEYAPLALCPNGFYATSTINDFPLRDKKVVLHVRRRRWDKQVKLSGKGEKNCGEPPTIQDKHWYNVSYCAFLSVSAKVLLFPELKNRNIKKIQT